MVERERGRGGGRGGGRGRKTDRNYVLKLRSPVNGCGKEDVHDVMRDTRSVELKITSAKIAIYKVTNEYTDVVYERSTECVLKSVYMVDLLDCTSTVT